jgi:hypothetical protein
VEWVKWRNRDYRVPERQGASQGLLLDVFCRKLRYVTQRLRTDHIPGGAEVVQAEVAGALGESEEALP